MSGARKDIQRLIDEAARQGFRIERCGSGHWKIREPEGQGERFVIAAFSPNSGYALHRIRRDLRRLGFRQGD